MNVRRVGEPLRWRRLGIAALGVATFGLMSVVTATPAPAKNLFNVPKNIYNVLNSVSCTSATACMAAGYYFSSSRVERTLVASWDGTAWSLLPSPNKGPNLNRLVGVSCVSASSCTAVGLYINSRGVNRTLIESWDGSGWSLVPSPNNGTNRNYLAGVSCVSSSSCVAVGSYLDNGRGPRTLIESWDGTIWSIVSSPNEGNGKNLLRDVACVSVNSCTTVGDYINRGGAPQTLIESWDGTAWSVASSPNNGTVNDVLNGVTCVSASSCVAVGRYHDDSGRVRRTLIESWDGSAWSSVSSPNAGASRNRLNSVSCVSARNCTSVGEYMNSGNVHQTLVESWDGKTWSIVSSPNEGTDTNLLGAVSCVSVSFCAAVGWYRDTESHMYEPLIESWDGTAWSIVPSPVG